MWEWLASGLCQKQCKKTHVWNIKSQQHYTSQRPKQLVINPPVKKEETQVVDLDWNKHPRIDSYFLEGTTQTIIRQEIYKKISLHKKSPFYTKDLFSISMRNVNEKVINEKKIIIPFDPDEHMDQEDLLKTPENSEQDFQQEDSVVHAQIETLPRDSDSSVVSFNVCRVEELVERPRPPSSCSDAGNHSDRSEPGDTMVTDVDSIENGGSEPRVACSDHAGEIVGQDQLTVRNSRYGRVNVLRWMKDADMPALERTCNGALALHYAAARGCLDCVRLLVDASTELGANSQMDNDVTPVYLAAQEGHLEVLKFLVLEAGGSLYVRAKDGMAPVHAASQMGCLNCLKWMIQDQGVDPNLRDGDGATPLHFAASRGHVEVVRWLLRHGAKLVIDKYGKSPINDAAENHQMECLNLLVQRGTTPDYHDDLRQGKLHGCTCRLGENTVCSYADCVNYGNTKEPFYLHPPGPVSKESPPVKDGLYINPMTQGSHGFYLHNPLEVPYHRVKDLFQPEKSGFATYSKPPPPPPPPPLTVKVEVHSSSSGAGSDENMSSSDLSERGSGSGAGGEHDYEDIYLVRTEAGQPRSRSRDSGSHSRSASLSSTHSNVIVHEPTAHEPYPMNNTINTSQKPDIKSNDVDQSQKAKSKLNHSHSMPYQPPNSRALKRVVSEPGAALPPPPPPPPPEDLSLTSSPDISIQLNRSESDVKTQSSESQLSQSSTDSLNTDEVSTLRGSSASTSDSAEATMPGAESAPVSEPQPHGPNLVNKQMVLPFIPPKFPSSGDGDEHSLIKPSEYLRALGTKPAPAPAPVAAPPPLKAEPLPVVHTYQGEDKTGNSMTSAGPPPPPLPEPAPAPSPATRKADQPLGTISIQDLNSVQLRRTTKLLSKTMSAPLAATGSVEVVKHDLIEELKKSKDITGIKKMKVEKVKMEEQHEKELVSEISKQLSVDSFVGKIPDKDANGNPVPPWKRQMLAKKAADKARKEMEEALAKEAEERRLQSIPAWKRQLLQSKKPEDKQPMTLSTLIYDEKNSVPSIEIIENHSTKENKENNKPVPVAVHNHKESAQVTQKTEEEPTQIIPWRAQLRKTNSTLNLLE